MVIIDASELKDNKQWVEYTFHSFIINHTEKPYQGKQGSLFISLIRHVAKSEKPISANTKQFIIKGIVFSLMILVTR